MGGIRSRKWEVSGAENGRSPEQKMGGIRSRNGRSPPEKWEGSAGQMGDPPLGKRRDPAISPAEGSYPLPEFI